MDRMQGEQGDGGVAMAPTFDLLLLPDEVSSLLPVMVQYGFSSEAQGVQREFSALISFISPQLEEVWPPNPLPPPLPHPLDFTGPDSTANSISAAMATSHPPPQWQQQQPGEQ